MQVGEFDNEILPGYVYFGTNFRCLVANLGHISHFLSTLWGFSPLFFTQFGPLEKVFQTSALVPAPEVVPLFRFSAVDQIMLTQNFT